jgi:hypothetical protein
MIVYIQVISHIVQRNMKMLRLIVSDGDFPDSKWVENFGRDLNKAGWSDDMIKMKCNEVDAKLNENDPKMEIWTAELLAEIDNVARREFAKC